MNEKSERSHSPPFGETSESIQENIAQSAGKLLETTKSNNINEHQQHSPSPSSSSEYSTDDSSQNADGPAKSTVPYERLVNDDEEEEDDDQYLEQPKKLPIDSSPKPQAQLTTNTNDRVKCISTNGYNSHGSSITTKSSSDNSGSVRTNSGSDNEEESDEEHYNNSSATNTTINNTNHSSYSTRNANLYRNQDLNYQTAKYSETTQKKGELHGQISRFKHLPTEGRLLSDLLY